MIIRKNNIQESSFLLLGIVIIEGFISIGVEIFAIRQMVPYVGSNILNTSIIIGIFLLFLSFGYYKGGIVRNHHEKVLLNNLLNSALLICIGLSTVFLSWFFSWFVSLGNLYGLVIFCLLIIAPVTFFLGQTIPIITNFMKNTHYAKMNGTLLFVSTLGSFLGSILTSVLLLNFMGLKGTLFVYMVLLIGLIMVLSYYVKLKKWLFYIRMTFIVMLTFGLNVPNMYLYSNEYSSVKIAQRGGVNYLSINHSFSSSYDKTSNNSTFEYIHVLQNMIASMGKKKKKILVIGAGGFTLSLNDNINEYTYVDVDRDLKEYVEKYFLQKKINAQFIVSDIRYYFTQIKEKYDVIVLDAFSNKHSIPSFLLTHDFFLEIKKHLTFNGALLINFIGNSSFANKYTQHFNQTVHKEYNCLVNALKRENKTTNMVYECYCKNDDIVYTDNHINLLELAFF
jgi:predicted membrane-bound spermidine synthase